MTTLSIHPIEHLSMPVNYAHMMKKLLRLLILIGFTLFLVGGFYNTVAFINTAERDAVTQTYMNAFPSEMPDVVIEPMNGFPVY